MFAKVHPAEDVKSGNTGSCHDLVRYLEKETGEGQRFFSHTEQDISPERVIMDIDGNKKALGANDAKFFMLSLNPSQSEQMHLIGRKVDDFKELTPQEKKEVFQKLEAFTRSAMDEYALNFGRDNIRGGQDLMYYARVETERSYHPEDEEVKQGIARIGEPKPGLNLHVHVIVSRKSLDGKVKLSPGAKSAGNTWELEGRGTVKRGFSHEGWKVRVQECFNRKFDYQAKEGETYVRPQVSAEIGKITNPELKRILQDEQFTAANQIVAAMREQGYTHQVRKGVHSFSREGEVFQVEHRLLKAFEQPLSDEQLKSITERFDLTKYEANPAGYRENGLQVKDISFSTYVKDEAQKGEKALKEVAYKVVYDEQNHTTVSFATVRQFAYEHQINLVKSEPTAEAVLKKIKNPELKNLLENYRFTSANQIVGKYSINSLVYWVTYVHNVVYSFYRSMIYCYINSTQRCAGSIVIDIIPTNGADKRKFFPFAPYFPVTNVIKRYFYPYFPAIIGIKGYSFPYFPYLSGIMKIKTALYSLFSRLDWHKTVVFPCLGEIYEGIRSLSWEIPVT